MSETISVATRIRPEGPTTTIPLLPPAMSGEREDGTRVAVHGAEDGVTVYVRRAGKGFTYRVDLTEVIGRIVEDFDGREG